MPSDINVIGVGHAYTTGDINFDPVLQISDADMRLNTTALRYVHTFELLEKSARVEVGQGYMQGKWTGKVEGIDTTVHRDGLTDSVFSLCCESLRSSTAQGQRLSRIPKIRV